MSAEQFQWHEKVIWYCMTVSDFNLFSIKSSFSLLAFFVVWLLFPARKFVYQRLKEALLYFSCFSLKTVRFEVHFRAAGNCSAIFQMRFKISFLDFFATELNTFVLYFFIRHANMLQPSHNSILVSKSLKMEKMELLITLKIIVDDQVPCFTFSYSTTVKIKCKYTEKSESFNIYSCKQSKLSWFFVVVENTILASIFFYLNTVFSLLVSIFLHHFRNPFFSKIWVFQSEGCSLRG